MVIEMSDTEDGLELVWGAEAIAAEIGRTLRATFYLLENGELPARKCGGRWVADRRVLRRFFLGEAARDVA